MTEKVREVSRMKQEAWLRWVKKPGDTILKAQYQQLKTQSRKAGGKAKKDELKQRRETCSQGQTQSVWRCTVLECGFVGRSKAGLVNHVGQKHSGAAQCRQRCPHCGRLLQKQGYTMHVRYCEDNPARRVT